MNVEEIRTIGVVGAGTMGAGIAQVCLSRGYTVLLYDLAPAAAEAARRGIEAGLRRQEEKGRLPSAADAMARLALASGLDAFAAADFVIEAVVEDCTAKTEVLRALAGGAGARGPCRPEVTLASNTSSISITRLGTASGQPARVVGMHFFNPAPVMALVEVVRGLRTSDAAFDLTIELARRLGKTPVAAADRPGFLANRILMPMLNEAMFALQEGVGDAPAIDQVMKLGMNHPMGPLELADFIGLDVCLAIIEVLHQELGDPKYRPCPLLRKYVEAGWLGRKSGRGFYTYPSEK